MTDRYSSKFTAYPQLIKLLSTTLGIIFCSFILGRAVAILSFKGFFVLVSSVSELLWTIFLQAEKRSLKTSKASCPPSGVFMKRFVGGLVSKLGWLQQHPDRDAHLHLEIHLTTHQIRERKQF